MRPIVAAVILSLRSLIRARAALQLEILALRHQWQVLERSRQPRLRLTATDRLLWVWFSRTWSEWRSALVPVQPATVIAWHRRGFRLFWTWRAVTAPGGYDGTDATHRIWPAQVRRRRSTNLETAMPIHTNSVLSTMASSSISR